MLNRNASLSALDASLFPVTRIANAVVWRCTDAIMASAYAYRYAFSSSHVGRTYDVATFARALIQASAVSVETGQFAKRLCYLTSPLRDASSGIWIDRETVVAAATIRAYAAAVWSTVWLALRLGLLIRFLIRLGTPSSDRIDGHSVVADAHVRADAKAVRTATVSALERGRERDASSGIRVQAKAQVARAFVDTDASGVWAAIDLTVGDLRLGLQRIDAPTIGVAGVASVAVANPWSDAHAIAAILWTMRDARAVVIWNVAWIAVADSRGQALAMSATLGTLWNAFVAVEVEGEAWFALTDTRGNALSVDATSRTRGDAFVRGVEGEAYFALADTWRDTFAVDATLRTLGDAFVRGVEDEACFAVADTWRDAFAVDATRRAIRDAGLLVTRRINESFLTSAHSRGSTFSVATAIFAHGHALFRLDAGGNLRRWLNHVSLPASARPGCHTLAVFTAAGADWFTLAVFFFVT